MQKFNLCYEEYMEELRQYQDAPLIIALQDQRYAVYYVQGLHVPVPTKETYVLSGNNVDGFIVTVHLKT